MRTSFDQFKNQLGVEKLQWFKSSTEGSERLVAPLPVLNVNGEPKLIVTHKDFEIKNPEKWVYPIPNSENYVLSNNAATPVAEF